MLLFFATQCLTSNFTHEETSFFSNAENIPIMVRSTQRHIKVPVLSSLLLSRPHPARASARLKASIFLKERLPTGKTLPFHYSLAS